VSASPFPLPLVFSAWGTGIGGEWEGSIGPLVALAKQVGAKTLAVQISKTLPRQVADAKAAGMFVVGWDSVGPGWKARCDALGLDGFMPQVEGPGQYAGALAALVEGCGAGLPCAVVTTYGGLDNPDGSLWQALARRGVTGCFVECYAADDPVIHADLDRMLGQGVAYGIPAGELRAVCGTYRGELPSAYSGLTARAKEIGLYLAEMTNAAQWAAWAQLMTAAPAPPPATVAWWECRAGAALLHEEQAKTYADGSTGLGRSVLWMQQNLAAIRAAKAVTLKRVLR
jgi:hypothetical protein